MERLPLEEYDPIGVQAVGNSGRPIAGQSLTTDADTPRPYETAPQFTNFKKALDFTVAELIDEENYVSIISGIGEGIPISDVVQQVLYGGFKEGQWNPDLMMMLIEPLMYILIALCEKAGVDYTLYRGEEDEDETELEEDNNNKFTQIQALAKTKMPDKSKVSKASVPAEILDKIEDLEINTSLLDKQEPMQEPMQEPTTSLLGKPE